LTLLNSKQNVERIDEIENEDLRKVTFGDSQNINNNENIGQKRGKNHCKLYNIHFVFFLNFLKLN